MSNGSEIARLRAQIEAEYEAAQQAMTGLAQGARHEFITARMERIGGYQVELAAVIGEAESMRVVCGIFEGAGPAAQVTRG